MLSVFVAAGVIFAAVATTLSLFLYLPSLAVAESHHPEGRGSFLCLA